MGSGKYGRIILGKIEYAKFDKKVKVHGRHIINPTPQTYLDMGYQELPTSNPEPGYHDEWYITADPEKPWRKVIAVRAVADDDDVEQPEDTVLRRIFTKGQLLEAIKACGLYKEAKQAYSSDIDLQIAWAAFDYVDMDNTVAQSIMRQYPKLFTEENVLKLQRYITSGGVSE